MSYPKDLDEYTYDQLMAEIQRRDAMMRAGRCTYCGRFTSETPCRFPERHTLKAQKALTNA